MTMADDDFDAALADPAALFPSPEAVLARRDYSQSQKLQILQRWQQDAEELSVAEEEGMAGGEPSLIERVSAALARLEQAS
jgi:hypothetical protein